MENIINAENLRHLKASLIGLPAAEKLQKIKEARQQHRKEINTCRNILEAYHESIAAQLLEMYDKAKA